MPPVLVLTAGYSRFLAAAMIPTRHAQDLVLGQWAVIRQLGAVPKLLVWDNEGGVGRYGGANPKLTAQFTVLRGMLGTRFYVTPAAGSGDEGTDRAQQRLLRDVVPAGAPVHRPGRLQRPAGRVPGPGERPQAAQSGRGVGGWTGSARTGPRWASLPPIEVATIGWRNSVVLPRDHYVRLDTCDYSVHPSAIGQRVEVDRRSGHGAHPRAAGSLVGEHPRCWARQQTITDPAHRQAADVMRRAFQDRTRRPGGARP